MHNNRQRASADGTTERECGLAHFDGNRRAEAMLNQTYGKPTAQKTLRRVRELAKIDGNKRRRNAKPYGKPTAHKN